MSSGDASVRSAWDDYRAAILAVLGPPAAEMVAGGQSDNLLETAAARSLALRDQIAPSLDDDSPDVREVAMLQLCAAATVDLGVADYVARLGHTPVEAVDAEGEQPDEAPASEAEQAGARAVLVEELAAAAPILTTERGTWPPVMLGGQQHSGGPRQTLGLESTQSLASISDRAADAALEVFVNGLLTLALPHVKTACTMPADKIFGHAAGSAPRLKRWALRLVQEGFAKLMSVFGSSGEMVREWVHDRLEAWSVNRLGPLVQRWVRDRLYEAPAIDAELRSMIEAASSDDEMFRASIDLRLLRHRFGDQMRVLERLARLIDRMAGWIVALAHVWGIVVLAVGYVAGTAFALLLGGDYIDWHGAENPGLLERVDGVRTIVARASAAQLKPPD